MGNKQLKHKYFKVLPLEAVYLRPAQHTAVAAGLCASVLERHFGAFGTGRGEFFEIICTSPCAKNSVFSHAIRAFDALTMN